MKSDPLGIHRLPSVIVIVRTIVIVMIIITSNDTNNDNHHDNDNNNNKYKHARGVQWEGGAVDGGSIQSTSV